MQDYQLIGKNKKKTLLFILFFCLLISALVFTISYLFSPEEAYFFGIFALLLAFLGSFFSYYYSDTILLKMANAHPVVKEEEPYLYHTIEGVAIAADIPTPKAYIIETDVPNAFATGRNPEHSAVAVTRGLLELMNREELEGVIAHEMAHIKNYDILFASVAIVLAGTLVYLADFVRRSLFYSGGRQRNKNNQKGNAFLIIIGLITIIFAPILAKLIQMAMSRSREYLADATAARTLGYPLGLASALEKLSSNQSPKQASREGFANDATAGLFIVNPLVKNFNVNSAFSTHPPLEKRIATLKNM
jgi:heat shock protein HtpX